MIIEAHGSTYKVSKAMGAKEGLLVVSLFIESDAGAGCADADAYNDTDTNTPLTAHIIPIEANRLL